MGLSTFYYLPLLARQVTIMSNPKRSSIRKEGNRVGSYSSNVIKIQRGGTVWSYKSVKLSPVFISRNTFAADVIKFQFESNGSIYVLPRDADGIQHRQRIDYAEEREVVTIGEQ